MIELDREEVHAALYDAGLDRESLYEGYSGRAMYGDKCFGIVGDDSDLIRFVQAASSRELEDPGDWLPNVRSDGMGLQTIYYWPGVTVATG